MNAGYGYRLVFRKSEAQRTNADIGGAACISHAISAPAKRMDMGPAAIKLNPKALLFSDDSYFDTNGIDRHAFQRPSQIQQQRTEERYITGVINEAYST